MAATIFKTVDKHTIHPFEAHKEWTITDSTVGEYSSSVNEAQYVFTSSLVDYGDNSSGLNKRSLFDSLHRRFYSDDDTLYITPPESLYQKKHLSNRAIMFVIDKDYYGDKIHPTSVSITDLSSGGSIVIKDDGNGNLYDSSVTSTVSSQSLVGYWSFDDSYILSSSITIPNFISKNEVEHVGYSDVHLDYVLFSDGIYNDWVDFQGTSGSLGIIPNYGAIQFRSTQSYAVSFWVNIPPSQSVTNVAFNGIVEKWNSRGGYPFSVRVYNQGAETGRIYGSTYDAMGNLYSVTTTSSFNDGNKHHVVYQKTDTEVALYIDNLLVGTSSLGNLGQIHSDSPLYLGGTGDPLTGSVLLPGSTIGTAPFSGSIDELRVYNNSLTTTEIGLLYTNPSNTQFVGNIFYSNGVMAFTNLSGSYNNLLLGSGGTGFTMTYKSSIDIREHEILVTANPDEFNMTLNPSSVSETSNGQYYDSFVTSSEWSPYVTGIGLYNDSMELIAVAKLVRPIKKYSDIGLTFAIRFDE